MNLSLKTLPAIAAGTANVPNKSIFNLPEKVLQFGTGILLRGLPDYYIDKANKQGVFNGRVVVVKSTSQGGTETFSHQDGLYTHVIKGLDGEAKIEEIILNASISRVLSANEQWNEILDCAGTPEMQIIISNTTEVGIKLDENDTISGNPPTSFPGKLLAFLVKRYEIFNGDVTKGMVIIPTELIVDNGIKLKEVVNQLARVNNLDSTFIAWLQNANQFCNSLVDRIVPGKLPPSEKEEIEQEYNYTDDLMIMSESYSLWAIETADEMVKEKLSFSTIDEGVVLAPDITKFRELKLRLLNGTHTLTCGLAHLAGCYTVKEAMDDEIISNYVEEVMVSEIAPSIVGANLSLNDAKAFAKKVRDRFKNPFIEHKWLSIAVQYSSKMKMRNMPVLLKHYELSETVPQLMAAGFAAYILFMKCTETETGIFGSFAGRVYLIQDDHAHWFAQRNHLAGAEIVKAVLCDTDFWETDLTLLPGFAHAVTDMYEQLMQGKVKQVIKQLLSAAIITNQV